MKTLYAVFFLLILTFSLNAQTSYTVTQATGKVELRLSGGSWQSIAAGAQVPVNATISTGFGSRAVLEGGGAVIRVEPLTRMSVDELQTNAEGGTDTRLALRTGRVRATVRSTQAGKTRFRVSSPVATAAVRGTEFSFNGYRVDVAKGTVAVSSASTGRSVNIPQGAGTLVDENGIPKTLAEARALLALVDSSAIPDALGDLLTAGDIGGSFGPQTLVVIIE
ncbi:MAG: FecR domain-containing protein [Spirochaetaceae bacterium]|nr:FecR domain-containing protein [Spirochaetaceae bacterium]